jgi:glycerol-3-phosphate dehydrogenase
MVVVEYEYGLREMQELFYEMSMRKELLMGLVGLGWYL